MSIYLQFGRDIFCQGECACADVRVSELIYRQRLAETQQRRVIGEYALRDLPSSPAESLKVKPQGRGEREGAHLERLTDRNEERLPRSPVAAFVYVPLCLYLDVEE